MFFVKFNCNPAGNKVGDCVIRAISLATNTSWDKVYADLCHIGAQKKAMPNDQKVYEEYLAADGTKTSFGKVVKGSKRITVKDFCKTFPKGRWVLQVANHLVAVKEGKYYDTWDCGNKAVYASFDTSYGD